MERKYYHLQKGKSKLQESSAEGGLNGLHFKGHATENNFTSV